MGESYQDRKDLKELSVIDYDMLKKEEKAG